MLDSVVSLTLSGPSQAASVQVPSGKTLMLFKADADVAVLAGDGDLTDGATGFPFASGQEHRLPVVAGDYYSFLSQTNGTLLVGLL